MDFFKNTNRTVLWYYSVSGFAKLLGHNNKNKEINELVKSIE